MSTTLAALTTMWTPTPFGEAWWSAQPRTSAAGAHTAAAAMQQAHSDAAVPRWDLVFEASAVSQQLCTAVAVSSLSFMLYKARTCLSSSSCCTQLLKRALCRTS